MIASPAIFDVPKIPVAQQGLSIHGLASLPPSDRGFKAKHADAGSARVRSKSPEPERLVLTPTTAEACLMEGVDPEELRPVPQAAFEAGAPGGGDNARALALLRFEAFERGRRDKLRAVQQAWERLRLERGGGGGGLYDSPPQTGGGGSGTGAGFEAEGEGEDDGPLEHFLSDPDAQPPPASPERSEAGGPVRSAAEGPGGVSPTAATAAAARAAASRSSRPRSGGRSVSPRPLLLPSGDAASAGGHGVRRTAGGTVISGPVTIAEILLASPRLPPPLPGAAASAAAAATSPGGGRAFTAPSPGGPRALQPRGSVSGDGAGAGAGAAADAPGGGWGGGVGGGTSVAGGVSEREGRRTDVARRKQQREIAALIASEMQIARAQAEADEAAGREAARRAVRGSRAAGRQDRAGG